MCLGVPGKVLEVRKDDLGLVWGRVQFAGIGFETTIPTNAMAVWMAKGFPSSWLGSSRWIYLRGHICWYSCLKKGRQRWGTERHNG